MSSTSRSPSTPARSSKQRHSPPFGVHSPTEGIHLRVRSHGGSSLEEIKHPMLSGSGLSPPRQKGPMHSPNSCLPLGTPSPLRTPSREEDDQAQDERPRTIPPLVAVALFLFVGAAIMFVASNSTFSAPPPPPSAEELAEQIVKLTHGAGADRLVLEPVQRNLEEVALRDRLAMSEEENAKLSQLEVSEREELKKKDEEIERLKRELLAKAGSEATDGSQLRGNNPKSQEEWLWDQVKQRRTEIQSRDLVAAWTFGPGPHRVQITLDFPKDSPPGPPQNPNADTFVIELAPLKMMPHSVHTFLRQVNAGLWSKGCSFYRNADHILQAAPVTNSENGEEKLFEDGAFRQAGLYGVKFPEYNPDYPHVKYTVGFAREGPTFYINKRDNTKAHGPGGQNGMYGEDEGEPCFGKIVSGFDAVERMGAMPNEEELSREETARRHYWMKESVGIAKAEIL